MIALRYLAMELVNGLTHKINSLVVALPNRIDTRSRIKELVNCMKLLLGFELHSI